VFKGVAGLLAFVCCVAGGVAQPAAGMAQDERMAWWREARFGLFIHWGLYAIPAGEWKGATGHGEWIMHTAQIPVEEYERFRERFNPVRFDADAWVALAAEAGMKYIVITSKHHDGFCLFDSQFTDYDVMSTPFRRDIMKELAAAARRRGLRICWYHSIMDWHHPDYLPRRDWERRSAAGADFDRYRAHLKNQVRELLTNYGPIGVMWFDGEWEDTWTHAHGLDLFQLCREVAPHTIVNNRVDKGRAGMAGLTLEGGFAGDFGTPEQEVPPTGLPGVDWETCMTMNNHWGYNARDLDYKSADELVRTLVDVVSKGGNFLLNVGPTAEGEFPPQSVERLRAVGAWMRLNGPSIYGTQAGPFAALPWGRCTQRPLDGDDTRLFLHVFNWPADGRLVVPGIANTPLHCSLLTELDQPAARLIGARRDGDALVLTLRDVEPLPPVTVIALDVRGRPWVVPAPIISATDDIFVDAIQATAHIDPAALQSPDGGPPTRVVLRYTTDGSDPTRDAAVFDLPVSLRQTTTLAVRAFRDDAPFSPVGRRTFTRVTPRPAISGASAAELEPGLAYEYYEGDWQRLPDFDALSPARRGHVDGVSLPPRDRPERFGLRFRGFLQAPRDGVYRLHLRSDDGSRLYVGDQLVVENDGLHVAEERAGVIALAGGLHPVTITYFQRTGDVDLALAWTPPGESKAPVPPAALRRNRD
jgi:alpha-L-fucosidase